MLRDTGNNNAHIYIDVCLCVMYMKDGIRKGLIATILSTLIFDITIGERNLHLKETFIMNLYLMSARDPTNPFYAVMETKDVSVYHVI